MGECIMHGLRITSYPVLVTFLHPPFFLLVKVVDRCGEGHNANHCLRKCLKDKLQGIVDDIFPPSSPSKPPSELHWNARLLGNTCLDIPRKCPKPFLWRKILTNTEIMEKKKSS